MASKNQYTINNTDIITKKEPVILQNKVEPGKVLY